MNLNTEELTQHDGVKDARVWNKVPGKERIYLDTAKANGGRNWNGGVGYSTCYIDLTTKTLVARGEAGAATRKMLSGLFDELANKYGLTLDVRSR